VFANALYDLGWAERDGVHVAYDEDTLVDVQLVEPLLDEHRLSYALEAIAQDRIGRGKDESGLLAAGHAHELGRKIRQVKSQISWLPAKYVAGYGIIDAQLPREIWDIQRPLIEAEGLSDICLVEHGLIPMYLDMRRRGVRIDVDRVERSAAKLDEDVAGLVAEARRLTGVGVEIWEARSLAKLMDAVGASYGRTPRSREPKIGNEALERADHPACRAILEARQLGKLASTFLRGQILDQLHGDRVHGQVHPLKSDDGGTVTGRISMSNPNLLFIPIRNEEGREIRRMFLPEDGETWRKLDNSQQEVRLLVHFGVRCGMASAIEAQRRYREDPDLDYHQMVSDFTELPRKRAKSLNFAIIYGRGIRETAKELQLSIEETRALFAQHEAKMPFARAVARWCQDRVGAVGYLTTLLRRRQRFPKWEPRDWDLRDGRMLFLEDARRAWPGEQLCRARTHKALNALIQPSAADQTKKVMLDMWRDGCGRHVAIQIYDEFDLTSGGDAAAARVAEIMRDAVSLEVPVKVDSSSGPTWGGAS